jgi:hypothetical protein
VNGELSGGICDPNFRGASEKRREVEAEQKSIEKKKRGPFAHVHRLALDVQRGLNTITGPPIDDSH